MSEGLSNQDGKEAVLIGEKIFLGLVFLNNWECL